jgi:hypothetical protein
MNKASEYFSWAFLLVNTQMGLIKFGFGPYSTLNTDYGPTFCQVDKWPNYSTGTLPTATFYLRPATRFRARSALLARAPPPSYPCRLFDEMAEWDALVDAALARLADRTFSAPRAATRGPADLPGPEAMGPRRRRDPPRPRHAPGMVSRRSVPRVLPRSCCWEMSKL